MSFEVGQSLSPNLKGLFYNPNQFSCKKIGMINSILLLRASKILNAVKLGYSYWGLVRL